MSTLGLDTTPADQPVPQERDVSGLTPAELLDLARAGVVARRRAEVEDLRVVQAWADAHSSDPRLSHEGSPDTRSRVWAEDRLVTPGGEGTPGVQEFSIPELAMAREQSAAACERDLGDVLDLAHRLPLVWELTRRLACPVWLARKVARLTRLLPADKVGSVDAALARAITGEAPGR